MKQETKTVKHLLESLVTQYPRIYVFAQRRLLFKARQMNNIVQVLQINLENFRHSQNGATSGCW